MLSLLEFNDLAKTLLNCIVINERRTLLSTLGNFRYILLEDTGKVLTHTLLFGNMSLSSSDNPKILNATTNFILSTKRFDEQLF